MINLADSSDADIALSLTIEESKKIIKDRTKRKRKKYQNTVKHMIKTENKNINRYKSLET